MKRSTRQSPRIVAATESTAGRTRAPAADRTDHAIHGPTRLVNEPLPEKKRRAARILAGLKKRYPEADCALKHYDAFELLVATILSAQCTDETVNKVTPVLFAKYPTPTALAAANSEDVETIIHATGFFRQKTRSILATSTILVQEFAGCVPDNMEALLTLPGVARKTANVVLGTAFGKNEGVVVDTHVGRLASRLGLTWTAKDAKDAVKIENDLRRVVPRKQWTYLSHALIWHGRKVCSARRPACHECSLAKHCPSAGQFA